MDEEKVKDVTPTDEELNEVVQNVQTTIEEVEEQTVPSTDNELAVVNNQIMVPQTLKEEMTKATANTYCSLDLSKREKRIKLYNVMTKCDGLIRDSLNKELELEDVYISKFERVDNRTGEVKPHYFTVFFLSDGTTLCSTAYGIFYSLERLFAIMGYPSEWGEPLKVKVVEKDMKRREGKTLSVEIC